jgi:hypothetical protein
MNLETEWRKGGEVGRRLEGWVSRLFQECTGLLGGGARGKRGSGAAQKQNSEYSWSMERRRMVKEREGERERG